MGYIFLGCALLLAMYGNLASMALLQQIRDEMRMGVGKTHRKSVIVHTVLLCLSSCFIVGYIAVVVAWP